MSNPAPDPWSDFRTLTAARIALGRSGGSVPTCELLDFGLAHARARDAVTIPFDADVLIGQLQGKGLQTLLLQSAAANRNEYLRRPDLGRQLSEASRQRLTEFPKGRYDLCVIVSDGLSSRATEHAGVVVCDLHSRLASAGWRIAPVIVVPFARVSIQDEIGKLLGAALSLILLGERPGLGSPDSLGAYFVYDPGSGNSDANRNCVSNIRPEGLPPAAAVATLQYLLTAARHRRLSGIGLKDERLLSRFPSEGTACPSLPEFPENQ